MGLNSISQQANRATEEFISEIRKLASEAQRTDKDELLLENERLNRLNSKLRKRLDKERAMNFRIVSTLPEEHPARTILLKGGE